MLILQSLVNELDPRSATFQWIFSLSFNWGVLIPFVPRIRSSIQRRKATLAESNRKKKHNDNSAAKEQEVANFKSRFIEAAYELSEELDLPLDKLGVMFDRVLTTGTRKVEVDKDGKDKSGKIVKGDEESSIHGISLTLPDSEGIMLIVVRELGDDGSSSSQGGYQEKQGFSHPIDTAESWTARGYRLTDTKFFGGILAERLGVNKVAADSFLTACKTYASECIARLGAAQISWLTLLNFLERGTRPVVQASGVYLGRESTS